jgi:tripartite-type tricarboxylate transporter receptor subunit TctC
VRVLAVSQHERLSAAPDIPTAAEAGLPAFDINTWFGIVAPRGTPERIVATLVRQIHAMQDDPSVQKRLADSGLEPLKESPEQFRARMLRDHERFRGIVQAAGLKAE